MTPVQLLPLTHFKDEVRALFWESILIGHPLPFDLTCARQYEALCLDWYLTKGSKHGVVATVGERVVGYCLFCADSKSFARSQALRTSILIGSVLVAMLTFRLNLESFRFYRYRFLDSLAIIRNRRKLPRDVRMHAHMNIDRAFHSGSVALRLRSHADAMCSDNHVPAYFGEINSVGGGRVVGLTRVAGDIVNNTQNRTFSWLTGEDVHRLTLIRFIDMTESKVA